jgi:Reverse transcriptase (RNA-dependent DNA polymerase)
MDMPPGLVAPSEGNLVCRLKKAIYGLKQSPRAWYEKISLTLVKVRIKKVRQTLQCSLRYQDKVLFDLIITRSDQNCIENLKLHLRKEFDIKDF